MTLNNLALLQDKLNQNQEALKNYKEALKIYKELASKNPNAFNSDVAMTLNNLAILQKKLNQNQEALKNYKEALKIYKELVEKNFRVYGIYYAKSLIMGVGLFNQSKSYLKKAKEILQNFSAVPEAEYWLKIIKELEDR